MKYLITEEQYNRMVSSNLLWILRRHKLIKDVLTHVINDTDTCRYKTFHQYEPVFYEIFMDYLHPLYYEIENFDYEGTKEELMNLFYLEVTKAYHDGKKKCL